MAHSIVVVDKPLTKELREIVDIVGQSPQADLDTLGHLVYSSHQLDTILERLSYLQPEIEEMETDNATLNNSKIELRQENEKLEERYERLEAENKRLSTNRRALAIVGALVLAFLLIWPEAIGIRRDVGLGIAAFLVVVLWFLNQ